jgi:uncharacterized protein (TIGR02594 family)
MFGQDNLLSRVERLTEAQRRALPPDSMHRRQYLRKLLAGAVSVWAGPTLLTLPRHLSADEKGELFLPTDFSPYPWMEFALREYGIRGISHRGRTVNVTAYLKATGVGRSNDETAWCSAFVNWCLLMASFPGTGKANARSWLDWGGVTLDFPVYGSVVVLWRGSRDGWLGHVGFFVGMQGDNLLLLGGNQGNAVSVRPYSKLRVLGMRWIEGFPVPEDI